jgi:hypothetical protein
MAKLKSMEERAERIQGGAASNGRRVDGRALQPWVERVESKRPG